MRGAIYREGDEQTEYHVNASDFTTCHSPEGDKNCTRREKIPACSLAADWVKTHPEHVDKRRARPELAEGANGHVRKFATHETVRAEAIRIMNEVFRPSGATCCLCGIEHFI